MCEMEVNSFQATDVILQAMAHNASTIDRDCDMVTEVLKARNEDKKLVCVNRFQTLIHEAYALMLAEYGIAVAEYTKTDEGGKVLVGNEKGHSHTIMEEIVKSTEEARKYETR